MRQLTNTRTGGQDLSDRSVLRVAVRGEADAHAFDFDLLTIACLNPSAIGFGETIVDAASAKEK